MNLILIEGVPGSGKSSLAETLYRKAISKGISASWYLEESGDHPVHPEKVVDSKNYAECFLRRWTEFVAANTETSHLFILEGSYFQSTIRFMLQADLECMIPGYIKECERLFAGGSTKLIYLRPSDIDTHIDWISEVRGEVWADKVSGYLVQTPFCQRRGWQVEDCMMEFWSYYAGVCDVLVKDTTLPSIVIPSGNGVFTSQVDIAIDFVGLD